MPDVRVDFIKAAIWHGSLDRANALLAEHPELTGTDTSTDTSSHPDIHIAAILGDDAAVRRCLSIDPASVHAKSEPHGADALNYLCLSKYLRLDPSRSEAFLRAATALLDAGADPNTGFWTKGPHAEFETALYGAAGVAHHAPLTRLLLERGADPNDGEVAYHSPESYDNAAMQAVVETGRLTRESLSLMLLRKIDWHDLEGVRVLLDRGADSNAGWKRAGRPLHHALVRSNSLQIIELLLDRGADPTLAAHEAGETNEAGAASNAGGTSNAGGARGAGAASEGLTAIARAAREGRADVLAAIARRGVPIALDGVDRLIAACAMDDADAIRAIVQQEDGPALVREVIAMGGDLLAKFAGNDNEAGVRQLLDLGVDVAAPFATGDGYFDEPAGSLAIHLAAWRAYPAIVRLLIARGSPVDLPDPNGRTPLALAIKACVDSYWAGRRTPESVDALLRAGASVRGLPFPTGYADVDDLLRRHGATA
jgi:ankyrin repeat protein